MNSIKEAHKLQKKTREPRRSLEEKDPGRSTTDLLRYGCATLINRKSTAVQAPGSEHAGPGELESCPTNGKMSTKCLHRQAHVYR